MSQEELKKPPLNPGWVIAVIAVVGQIILIGRISQRDDTTSADVVELKVWRASTEKRMAEADKQAAVSATQVASELRFMNANLDAMRRSLEARGIPVQAPTASSTP